ncbi:leucine-rich repeat-containing protein 4 [Orussus abietinus]|uniref:leucine-rich repeat-containing protein 4 n=1 Tax=Orussus abietinus TaxID=222816 RepID=UPI000625A2E1|nr:leucine-rich repeat-containing protein 4 [Orussus abietinus]
MWPGALAFLAIGLALATSKTVDLSWRRLKKEEFFLTLQNSFNLHEVTELILRGNEFDSFLDCSTNLDNLKILDLSQNHLQRFFFLCKEEYNLQVLNVSHNRLEYIDDNALNDRITKLQVLDLSWNSLSAVNRTMLEHMKVLDFLSLANNPIVYGIHDDAFLNLGALKHLDLANVSAIEFSSELFKPLRNLATLNISSNPIETIPTLPTGLKYLDLSSTNIVRPSNLYLPKLQVLLMNAMPNLTSLLLNEFENLTSLVSLSMADCTRFAQFRIWPPRGDLLPRLQRLVVRNCSIETLSGDLWPIMQKTTYLDLQYNPWNCDCRMEWIVTLNLSRDLTREIRCRTPEQHCNKRLIDIPRYELQCEYLSNTFHLALWICILVLILSGALASVFFLTRGTICQLIARSKSRDTVAYKNVVESSNDLVRILSVGENPEAAEE